MEKHKAIEFIEECIDNNRVSSKPKAVMQTGFNKKAIDKYKALIEREKEECELVNEFTKPSFEDIMNNIDNQAEILKWFKKLTTKNVDDLEEAIPGFIKAIKKNKATQVSSVRKMDYDSNYNYKVVVTGYSGNYQIPIKINDTDITKDSVVKNGDKVDFYITVYYFKRLHDWKSCIRG